MLGVERSSRSAAQRVRGSMLLARERDRHGHGSGERTPRLELVGADDEGSVVWSAAMLGSLVLVALTGLAAFAALGVAVRAELASRAETFVLWTGLFVMLLVTPVLALGYAHRLWPAALALASFATSSAAFAASARGRGLGPHACSTARRARDLCLLPFEGLHLAFARRSFVALGLLAAGLAIAGSLVLTYLAPSECWDGFFYHEPMVGFAIQNHGFQMVDLPRNMLVQAANGYPRLCEALALWFVVFTDKTFIEIGNTLAAPGLVFATFLLARRYAGDPVPAMGWGAAVLLLPAMFSQLRTTMIDVEVAFFLVAALYFATRPEMRLADALAATLFMALLLGSKSIALVWVPPLVLVAYVRLAIAAGKGRLRSALVLVAFALPLLAGVAALTFGRNWRAFGNPLWPVTYENPKLHIAWRGLATLAEVSRDLPLRDLVKVVFDHPSGGVGDIIARDYGYGAPWVLLPLALVALPVILGRAARGRFRGDPDPLAENALLLAALGAAFVKLTPSLSIARYNVHVVAIGAACVACWAGRRKELVRFHEGAVACTLVLSIVPWVWTGFLGGLELDERGIAALFRRSAAERASMNVASFQMPAAVARAREKELGPGDLVVLTDDTSFPGVLWNHRFENRVEYLPFESRAAFLAGLDERCPKWVIAGARSGGRAALETLPSVWQQVGPAVRQDGTFVYRRVAACRG
jgi:hypothetical protein